MNEPYLVKRDDGYHIVDIDGNEGTVCKISKDNKFICLNRNSLGMKRISLVVAERMFEAGYDKILLFNYYCTKDLPNKKLIEYLAPQLIDECSFIVRNARFRMRCEKVKGKKSIFDYMTESEYNRYNELIYLAEAAKPDAPKLQRSKRGAMSEERKKALAEARLAKAKEKLEKLLAENRED